MENKPLPDDVSVALNRDLFDLLSCDGAAEIPVNKDTNQRVFDADVISRATISGVEAAKFRMESRQIILRDPETEARVVCYRHRDGRVLLDSIRLPEEAHQKQPYNRYRYYRCDTTPWKDLAQVFTWVPTNRRFIGLTVLVGEGADLAEYWFANGVRDEDLVWKQKITNMPYEGTVGGGTTGE